MPPPLELRPARRPSSGAPAKASSPNARGASAGTPLFLARLLQRQPDGDAGQGGSGPGKLQTDGAGAGSTPGPAPAEEGAAEFWDEHARRRLRLDETAHDIDLASDARRDLQDRIDAMPQSTSVELEKQRTSLEADIRKKEELLEERLPERIALLDEALQALDAARSRFTEVTRIESEASRIVAERSLDKERLLAVQRPLARKRIKEIEVELGQAGLTDERRAKLEERRKSLGELLSSTARQRTPPGTAGRIHGEVYVVYLNEVKVGGSLPWVNNNPGNVAPAKYEAKPPGAIGVNPAGTAGGFYIFATVEAGENASMEWIERLKGSRLDNFLMWYSQGDLDKVPDPEKQAKKRGEGEAYIDRVLGRCHLERSRVIATLSPTEKAALHQAIQAEESGGAQAMRAGDTYTCAKSSTPPEYRRMLGCDE